MDINDIKRICVIGCGTMGRQIAMVNALGGFAVILNDSSAEALEQAKQWAEKHLTDRVSKGKLTQAQADDARAHLTYETELEKAAGDVDLVIEAIVEIIEAKRELFAKLDKICPPHTIFGTNSSTLASSLIADVTGRPEKCCNIHYFNPALVMELVEVVRNPKTSDETIAIVMEVCRRIGKGPVLINKEVNGFVVSSILRSLIKEAIYLLEEEVATVEDIDYAVEKGLNHPMGPFRLADIVGLDVVYNTIQEQYKITAKAEDRPRQLLIDKCKAGTLGVKSGKGFYDYSSK